MKNVLITGGIGNLGQFVVGELENDYNLCIFDEKSKPNDFNHEYIQGDITDFSSVTSACRGVDAVVHLAAIPIDTGEALELWSVNSTGTFNVYEAAAQNGIKKVLYSSSICSYGFEFWSKPFTPDHFPLEETHPLKADDSYGMSKIIGEVLGYGYSNRYGMSICCFRLATILFPGLEFTKSWIEQIDNPEFDLLPGVVSIKDTIWAYVDARDVAKAFRLALENDDIQFEIFNIGAVDVFSNRESLELINKFYPDCREVNEELFQKNRFKALYGISKAERELKYQPAYTWRDYL